MNYIVYMHICPNGKKYVGITRRKVKERWHGGSGYKRHTYFYNAIKKYGWDNIEHRVLYKNLIFEEAKEKEIKLIKQYQTTNKLFGYNITNGGDGSKSVNDSVRKILSESHKGQKAWNKGIAMTEEQKRIISKPIICIETNKEYYSAREAEKMTGISYKNISNCLRKKSNRAGKLHWKYKESA